MGMPLSILDMIVQYGVRNLMLHEKQQPEKREYIGLGRVER